jgi:hypothetical protein
MMLRTSGCRQYADRLSDQQFAFSKQTVSWLVRHELVRRHHYVNRSGNKPSNPDAAAEQRSAGFWASSMRLFGARCGLPVPPIPNAGGRSHCLAGTVPTTVPAHVSPNDSPPVQASLCSIALQHESAKAMLDLL